jgi:hypothetical protein
VNKNPDVFRAIGQIDIEPHEGEPDGLLGGMFEPHSGLVWGSTPLFEVTRSTCGHDVVPAFFATTHDRFDMIESELADGWFLSTILTGMVVPDEHVVPVKANNVLSGFEGDKLDESNDPGNRDGDRNGSDHFARTLDDFDLSRKKQLYGFLPRNDLKGLKRCIEKKGPTFHSFMIS